jgi:hypothetical protein
LKIILVKTIYQRVSYFDLYYLHPSLNFYLNQSKLILDKKHQLAFTNTTPTLHIGTHHYQSPTTRTQTHHQHLINLIFFLIKRLCNCNRGITCTICWTYCFSTTGTHGRKILWSKNLWKWSRRLLGRWSLCCKQQRIPTASKALKQKIISLIFKIISACKWKCHQMKAYKNIKKVLGKIAKKIPVSVKISLDATNV